MPSKSKLSELRTDISHLPASKLLHYLLNNVFVGKIVGDGRVRETVHLAKALIPYDCWISAVYHSPKPENITHRADICGEKIRVDVLRHRSANDIRRFICDHDLPFHPRAKSRKIAKPTSQEAAADIYQF